MHIFFFFLELLSCFQNPWRRTPCNDRNRMYTGRTRCRLIYRYSLVSSFCLFSASVKRRRIKGSRAGWGVSRGGLMWERESLQNVWFLSRTAAAVHTNNSVCAWWTHHLSSLRLCQVSIKRLIFHASNKLNWWQTISLGFSRPRGPSHPPRLYLIFSIREKCRD